MMSLFHRAIPGALTLALGLSLSACSSSPDFDPTDLLPTSLFGSKKPIPGERRAVFPEGVPGVPQGVPQEMVKGYQAPEPEALPAPEAAPEKPVKSAAKPPAKPKPKKTSASPQPTAGAPARPAQSGQPTASPWPEPSAQNAWPPPNSNTFSR
jgi:hypothetical protein